MLSSQVPSNIKKVLRTQGFVRVDGLAGGDICITYDPSTLRAVGVSAASNILHTSNLTESGKVKIAFACSSKLHDTTLFQVRFSVISDGSSPLTLKTVDLYQPDALPIDSRRLDGTFSSLMVKPEHSSLLQNFPNPFNPETWIPYQLQEGSEVTIGIYSVSGNLVRKLDLGYMPAGLYLNSDRSAHWDGKNAAGEQVSSGIYFYTIQAGDFTATRKMAVAE